MKTTTKKGACLARDRETQASDSTGFRQSVELLSHQPMKGGESWAW